MFSSDKVNQIPERFRNRKKKSQKIILKSKTLTKNTNKTLNGPADIVYCKTFKK